MSVPVDQADFPVQADERHIPARDEFVRPVKPGVDHEFAGLVEVAPLFARVAGEQIWLITDLDNSELGIELAYDFVGAYGKGD